jgi:hypothetical protein
MTTGIVPARPATLGAAVLAVGLVLLASGCGTGSDRARAQATTERFFAAYGAGAGAAACAQLSPGLRTQVGRDHGGKPCAEAVLEIPLRDRTVGRIRVFATSAVADLGGEAVFLDQAGPDWRIDALGCRSAGAGPADCEEQA